MAVEKLPVPNTQLETSDFGTVFQQKMNEAMDNLRNAIIAYNNQVDAYLTAADFTEIASTEEMQDGDNNTKRVTPLGTNAAITHRIGTAGQLGNAAIRNVGVANGVAPLDGNNKIPLAHLSDSVLGQVEYQGTWNAGTNTPTLPTSPVKKGDYYVVSAGGTRFGLTFAVGDWLISNGTEWEKVDNTDAVSSVAGRTGNVTLVKADVGLGNVDNVSAAALRDRATHTGTQPLSSISDAGVAAGRGVTGSGDLMAVGYRGLGALSTAPVLDDSAIKHSGGFYVIDATTANNPFPTSGNNAAALVMPFSGSSQYAILANVESGINAVLIRRYHASGFTDALMHTSLTQLNLGTSPPAGRTALGLGNFATRNLTVSTSAPNAGQISAMLDGDLWGVYS